MEKDGPDEDVDLEFKCQYNSYTVKGGSGNLQTPRPRKEKRKDPYLDNCGGIWNSRRGRSGGLYESNTIKGLTKECSCW